MPKFCANLSMLFTDVEFPDRFDAAAQAGFRGVEFHFPYAFDRAMLAERMQRAGVETVLFNLPPGNWEKGDRGIACLPSRMSEFRDGVGLAIEYARALGCRRLNMLSGVVPETARRISAGVLRETFISNLRYAAGALEREGIALMMEPINTRSIPGIYLKYSAQALALISEAAVSNAWLQYDIFHMQIMEGDLSRTIEANLARIGHMQIADAPDRHEPGTGEINHAYLFEQIDRLGYSGWIGAEYLPANTAPGGTQAGLGWFSPYRMSVAGAPAAQPAS